MRRERVDLRVLPVERVRWAEAAGLLGLSLSEMVRRAMNAWVDGVLAEGGVAEGWVGGEDVVSSAVAGGFHVETGNGWELVDGVVRRVR